MVISPNLEISLETMENLISELQEMISRYGHRIASLKDRLGRQNEMILERPSQDERQFESQIKSLKSEIFRLKEGNELRQTGQTEIALRVGLLEKHEEERKKMLIEIGCVSEAEKIDELKADLISQSVLPERFSNCRGSPFEGLIAQFTREIGCNVADPGPVEITASSVCNDTHIAKYVAHLTDSEHSFGSKNEEINGLNGI
jgi:hypothetical protein